MLFSSTVFLFAFLPLVLALHLVLRDVRARNAVLLVASLVFYAWGEAVYVLLLVFSITANHLFGTWIDRSRGRPGDRLALAVAITANLLLLAAFKYANFIVDNIDVALVALGFAPIQLAPVHLPIGISFFTFQSLTYVVDIHRRDASAQRSPLRVGLYIALFPQLIAGPIVRYRRIAEQLAERNPRIEDVAAGLRRFVVGLGKKVLIANTLAVPADAIFAIPVDELETGVAWLGIVCFSLQIYFDFAGYSDMAIGLGRCFGFDFPENFDWPYTSHSLREFWRRWHMTLSTFFRDYLYIPLGGNRLGSARTAVNLLLVFLLCGLWHGAAWIFVVWGLLHGFFLALERTPFGRGLERAPALVQHMYVWFVVMVAWVFFRADTLSHALGYLGAMAGRGAEPGGVWPFVAVIDPLISSILAVASLSAFPWTRQLGAGFARSLEAPPLSLDVARLIAVGAVGLLCAMSLAAGTHNPFIYFRF
jgi:alginate O-acetyltransferase complex protein AlgI